MDSLRFARPFFLLIMLFTALLSWQGAYAEDPPGTVASVVTVNINTASADELSTVLKGVGEKRAQAIVNYRKANGPFKTLADLRSVKGIGESVLEKNSSNITF